MIGEPVVGETAAAAGTRKAELNRMRIGRASARVPDSLFRRRRSLALLIGSVFLLIVTGAAAPNAQNQGAEAGILIFAASSLQTALDALTPAMERAAGAPVRTSYAASSALARQLEDGAPAEIFISADLDWMDYAAARKSIRADTRVNLLSNRLVLVAPAGQRPNLTIARGFPVAAALGRGRLALADPMSVPAGKYAQAALTSLGVWDAVSSRIAATENVRAALRLVSRGEAPLGIVYRTDAHAEPGVVVVDTFPESSHPRIVYPAALTIAAGPGAQRVLAFLRGSQAGAVFAGEGFGVEAP